MRAHYSMSYAGVCVLKLLNEMCSYLHKFCRTTEKIKQWAVITSDLRKRTQTLAKSNNCPLHLKRITTPIKHLQTRLHIPKPNHKGIQIVITFGGSRYSGDCSDYHNTSQPAIPCAKKLIFSNYI